MFTVVGDEFDKISSTASTEPATRRHSRGHIDAKSVNVCTSLDIGKLARGRLSEGGILKAWLEDPSLSQDVLSYISPYDHTPFPAPKSTVDSEALKVDFDEDGTMLGVDKALIGVTAAADYPDAGLLKGSLRRTDVGRLPDLQSTTPFTLACVDGQLVTPCTKEYIAQLGNHVDKSGSRTGVCLKWAKAMPATVEITHSIAHERKRYNYTYTTIPLIDILWVPTVVVEEGDALAPIGGPYKYTPVMPDLAHAAATADILRLSARIMDLCLSPAVLSRRSAHLPAQVRVNLNNAVALQLDPETRLLADSDSNVMKLGAAKQYYSLTHKTSTR